MKIRKKLGWGLLSIISVVGIAYYSITHVNWSLKHQTGDVIDELNGVAVYHNGGVAHVEGRHLAADGYNLGLKYQCVEFIKRYYYEHFHHKMPDAYGHAKDFFNVQLTDGQVNAARGLRQYANPSDTKPKEGDLMVFSATVFNRFGHVAIVSDVGDDFIEIIQQNAGPFAYSREQYELSQDVNGQWLIGNSRVLGFLRMP